MLKCSPHCLSNHRNCSAYVSSARTPHFWQLCPSSRPTNALLHPWTLPGTSSDQTVWPCPPVIVAASAVAMKKRSEETQTTHAGCSKVEPKFFAPLKSPFPGVQDGQNLISWRWSLPLPTNSVWWGSMHTILSYRDNRPTKNKHTNRQGQLQYTTLQLSTQCNNTM